MTAKRYGAVYLVKTYTQSFNQEKNITNLCTVLRPKLESKAKLT